MVPTPTPEIVALIRKLLAEHNPLEEDPGGLYETCEQLAGAAADQLLAQVRAMPAVPLARHFDGPRAFQFIDKTLRACSALRGR